MNGLENQNISLKMLQLHQSSSVWNLNPETFKTAMFLFSDFINILTKHGLTSEQNPPGWHKELRFTYDLQSSGGGEPADTGELKCNLIAIRLLHQTIMTLHVCSHNAIGMWCYPSANHCTPSSTGNIALLYCGTVISEMERHCQIA